VEKVVALGRNRTAQVGRRWRDAVEAALVPVETGVVGRDQVAPGADYGGHEAQTPGRVAVVESADGDRLTAFDVGEGALEIDEAEGVLVLVSGRVGDFDKVPALDIHELNTLRF
jgi:hypothetical protein